MMGLHPRATLRRMTVARNLPAHLRASIAAQRQSGTVRVDAWPEQTPVIVIGMHRSGTTLLTDMLMSLGVFMGTTLGPETREAIFFRDLNEAMLRVGHSWWDFPEPFRLTLQNDLLCDAMAAWLVKQCAGWPTFWYQGWQNLLRARSLRSLPAPWGWKDPRNTYTLPIWQRVFPNARVIHIYRNAIDVADSLVRRQARQMARPRASDVSPRCFTHDDAFALWVEYVTMGREVLATTPAARRLEIRYESMLVAPEAAVDEIVRFLCLKTSRDASARAAALPQQDRGSAFLARADLLELHARVRTHPLMRQLGYAELDAIQHSVETPA